MKNSDDRFGRTSIDEDLGVGEYGEYRNPTAER